MSELGQRIKDHFSALERRRLVVPEWPDAEGDPLVIYSSPLTVHQVESIRNKSRTELDHWARTIVAKAEDETGKPHFDETDRLILQHDAEAVVVERVAKWIIEGDAPDAGELKN